MILTWHVNLNIWLNDHSLMASPPILSMSRMFVWSLLNEQIQLRTTPLFVNFRPYTLQISWWTASCLWILFSCKNCTTDSIWYVIVSFTAAVVLPRQRKLISTILLLSPAPPHQLIFCAWVYKSCDANPTPSCIASNLRFFFKWLFMLIFYWYQIILILQQFARTKQNFQSQKGHQWMTWLGLVSN